MEISAGARTLFTLEKSYITDLALDKDGNLILTSGDEGQVYKVEPNRHIFNADGFA